jgi:hypothetical protein
MSPHKLGGSRGLHPLESKPAVLKGYRLAFNHRWVPAGVFLCVHFVLIASVQQQQQQQQYH